MALLLLVGITDDPLILGSWFELKTDAANVPSRVIHAPSDLGEKPGAFPCLNSERLIRRRSRLKIRQPPSLETFSQDLVGEYGAMLVSTRDRQGNLQGDSFGASATTMAVCFCQVHEYVPPSRTS